MQGSSHQGYKGWQEQHKAEPSDNLYQQPDSDIFQPLATHRGIRTLMEEQSRGRRKGTLQGIFYMGLSFILLPPYPPLQLPSIPYPQHKYILCPLPACSTSGTYNTF